MTTVFALICNLPLPLFYIIAHKYSDFGGGGVLFVTTCQQTWDAPLWENTIRGKLLDESCADTFPHPSGVVAAGEDSLSESIRKSKVLPGGCHHNKSHRSDPSCFSHALPLSRNLLVCLCFLNIFQFLRDSNEDSHLLSKRAKKAENKNTNRKDRSVYLSLTSFGQFQNNEELYSRLALLCFFFTRKENITIQHTYKLYQKEIILFLPNVGLVFPFNVINDLKQEASYSKLQICACGCC